MTAMATPQQVDDVHSTLHVWNRMAEVIDRLGGLEHAEHLAQLLPRTADGATLAPGMMVWWPPSTEHLAVTMIGEDANGDGYVELDVAINDVPPEELYLSRENAEDRTPVVIEYDEIDFDDVDDEAMEDL